MKFIKMHVTFTCALLLRLLLLFIFGSANKCFAFPFDRLIFLRGKWDEYFLLRAFFNKRETKMSPQTYR
jgi:hypothetical protein